MLSIEVLDGATRLPVNRSRMQFACVVFSAQAGMQEFPLGKTFAGELTLGEVEWLPDHAGTFEVTATWKVYSCQNCDAAHTQPYAVVRSAPRVFHIAGQSPR